ncbi:putative O-methyltransferase [Tricladium varicosporioides]|nr:putative O-methyltransferase [Hymenoscyphus varicosporioides]
MSPLSLEVSIILNNISDVARSLEANKPSARESLISLSQELITTLELPSETIQRMGWAEPARNAHCRIGVDKGIFEHLKESGKQGASAKALAENTKVDLPLIARMLKHLSSMHVIKEKAAGVYTPTPLSDALVEPKFKDGIIYNFDVAGPSFASLPEYLKVTNYKNPTELTNGPFQYAHKTPLPFFAWLDQTPPYLSIFNNYMSAYRAGKPTWCDPGFYPIEHLTTGFDYTSNPALLVDVGGGIGHDLQELRKNHGSLPGDLILQDREEVISTLTPGTNFKAIAHDFFTPQPILHARAYYLHSVLHDWGDEDCIKILQNLISALKKGYSKVLINEIVVSEENATLAASSMDQLMLVLGAMKERTEEQWGEILAKAGYKVLNIWKYPGVAESLIEAEAKIDI